MFDLMKGSLADQQPPAHGRSRLPLLATCLCLATTAGMAAQGHGGGGRPMGGGGRGSGFPGMGGEPGKEAGGGRMPGGRNTMRRGPAGRWWDDTRYAHSVGLTDEQQRRMDAVFQENRGTLVSSLDTLRQAEARLSTLSASDHPSESALNAEIQNVAQARADLEKANTHMVLQIRNEMTEEQINRMEKLK